ncbi:MAG: metal-dependent hydrolase [Flavobacteriaceae bacterium]
MTAPNHIAGGIVITGLFCSLWNVNIFANPIYITTTFLGALLPDIDHTKSVIGKTAYPLAKWLSVKFGHRTITHSLVFLFSITALLYFLEHFRIIAIQQSITTNAHPITLILFFAVFSHLLLDMFTIQGIPLFYPFYRNPCVIPANVDLRIASGNLKQEGVALFIFAFLAMFLQDLFANGFWFTYNKQFNDITHLEREFKNANTLLNVNYDFNMFQENYQGNGFLVYADYQQCYILGDTLIHLNKYQQGQIINKLVPAKTKEALTITTCNFSNITIDSINQILANNFVSTGKIFSNQKIDLVTKEGLQNEIYFDVKNEYNLHFIKSIKDSLNHAIFKSVQDIEYKIKLEEDALNFSNSKYFRSRDQLKELKQKLHQVGQLSNYEINEIKNKIIKLENYLSNALPKRSKTMVKLYNQLEELKAKEVNPNIYLSGSVSYFQLPP